MANEEEKNDKKDILADEKMSQKEEKKAEIKQKKAYEVMMDLDFKNLESLTLDKLNDVLKFKKEKYEILLKKSEGFKKKKIVFALGIIAGAGVFSALSFFYPISLIGLVAWLVATIGASALYDAKLKKDKKSMLLEIQKILKRKFLLDSITDLVRGRVLTEEDVEQINDLNVHGNKDIGVIAEILDKTEKVRIDRKISSTERQQKEKAMRDREPYMEKEEEAPKTKERTQINGIID